MTVKHLRYVVTLTQLLAVIFVAHALAGEVQLAWDAPTTNTDGSTLTDLAGYALYYWEGASNIAEIIDAGNQTTYTLSGLAAGETYTVAVAAYDSDGNESDYSNSITVSIEADNHAPVAVNDAVSTPVGTSVTIAVLANDSDPDGDVLSVSSVTPGTYGNIIYNDTTVTYTPDATYSGTDSFFYSIDDGYGATATATVTVTVVQKTGPKNKGNRKGICNAKYRSC